MAKKRILIIDDETDFGKMLKINLERGDQYEARVEDKGAQGLSTAKQYRPDLILLDLVMPDMEGSQVASQILADEVLKNTPIMFLTATVTKEEIEANKGKIGGHTFVSKPVGLSELKNRIYSKLKQV